MVVPVVLPSDCIQWEFSDAQMVATSNGLLVLVPER